MNKGAELVKFSCFNGKFLVNGELEPKDLNYLTKISIEPNVTTKKIYGDGQVQLEVVTDPGSNIILGMTNKSHNYEIAMQRIKEIEGGVAHVRQVTLVPHALYFEFNVADKGQPTKVYKMWMFNCTTSAATDAYDQSTETINESPVEHTGVNLGIPLLKSGTSNEQAVDENGNLLWATRMICKPGDIGYATFGDALPVPREKAAI